MPMSEPRNGNRHMGAFGRLAVQLLVPAIAAAVASYIAVASQLVRLEERIESLRTEMRLRYSYIERDLGGLKKTDERLALEIDVVKARVP